MDQHEDILTEVLLRLPVRSLFKFRSVCKFWCSIIDSFPFRKSHLQNQLRNTEKYNEDVLLLQITIKNWHHCEFSMSADNGKSYKLDIPAFEEFISNVIGGLAVFGPVKGLICIHNWNSNPSIAICNPCLGKIKILPVSPIICSSLPTHCRIGFGFDYITGQYKVVQLTMSKEREINVEVYSPTTNTWRKLDTHIDISDYKSLVLDMKSMNNSAFKVRGRWAHWWKQLCINRDMLVILSFDMQNEVFKTRVLDISESWRRGVVGVYAKGDVSFVIFVHERICNLFDDKLSVWEGNERCLARVRDVQDLRSFGIMSSRTDLILHSDFVQDRKVGAVISDFDPMRLKLFVHYYHEKEGQLHATPKKLRNTVMLEYSCSLISP